MKHVLLLTALIPFLTQANLFTKEEINEMRNNRNRGAELCLKPTAHLANYLKEEVKSAAPVHLITKSDKVIQCSSTIGKDAFHINYTFETGEYSARNISRNRRYTGNAH